MIDREMVSGVLRRALKVEKVPLAASYIDAGGDSLQAVQIADDLNLAYGVDIDPWLLFEAETLDEFVRHVVEAGDGSPS